MIPKLRLVVLLSIIFSSYSGSLARAQGDLTGAYRVIASKRFVDLLIASGLRHPCGQASARQN